MIQSREETTNDTTVPITCEEHQQSTDSSESLKSFRTKQSLSRSIKKAEKALLFSPTKKISYQWLSKTRYQLRIQYQEKRGRKPDLLTEEEQEWLVNVFERPDITYINPGRKDNVCVLQKDGKREYVQKRYLLWTLRDLLNIINGVKLDGVSNINTFSDRFGKDLTFQAYITTSNPKNI